MINPKKIDEALYEYNSVCQLVEDVNESGLDFGRKCYEELKKLKKT
jgi:hypothetical protein